MEDAAENYASTVFVRIAPRVGTPSPPCALTIENPMQMRLNRRRIGGAYGVDVGDRLRTTDHPVIRTDCIQSIGDQPVGRCLLDDEG